jgi:hypothetical protein
MYKPLPKGYLSALYNYFEGKKYPGKIERITDGSSSSSTSGKFILAQYILDEGGGGFLVELERIGRKTKVGCRKVIKNHIITIGKKAYLTNSTKTHYQLKQIRL